MKLDTVFQVAYLTRDINKAMAKFRAGADIRTEVYIEAEIVTRTPAGPRDYHAKIAFMWVGDFNYELIEPVSGLEEFHKDFVPEDDSLRFHHICTRVPDWDLFRASLENQPYPIAFEGGTGPNYFLYLDARKTLGHFLEYAYLPDAIWKATGGR